jgi:hypothetical protein
MKSPHVNQYYIVTHTNFSDTFIAAMDGNPDFAHGIRLIAEWLVEAKKRDSSGNGFLCLDCDTVFGTGQEPEAFLIVLPVFEGEYGTVTGICPTCLAEDNLDHRILRRLRTAWPDAQPLSKGTA